jgi:crotonobetaine/carnitine-CoA ligase
MHADLTPEPTESVPRLLQRRALEDPDGILIQDVRGPVITNAQFQAQAMQVASALAALGIAPGECVVTMGDPRIEAHVCWIGICWAGAMEVPVNPEFRGTSLTYGISDSRARVLITSNAYLQKIRDVRPDLPHIEHVLTLDASVPDGFDDVRALPDLMSRAPFRDFPVPQLTDPYAVIYTSGTTGPSKGVVVPWGSIQYSTMDRLFAGDRVADHADPAFYSPWPVFHSSGRTGMTFATVYGGRFVIRERLSVGAFWDDIRRFNCSHAHLLGVANFLFVQPEKPDDADNPLKRVLMNPVLPEYKAFQDRFGVMISTGWGMTEIGFPTAADDLPNARTCGRMSALYDARIVDDEGQDVPEGGVGQLVIRPKRPWLLLREYLNKPEANAKNWRDGWYQSGDALRRDADGYYYFVDRVADYMRVRGNNVSSVEVEREVRAHPAVADVAAIGVKAPVVEIAGGDTGGARTAASEDEIKLIVVLKAGAQLTEHALLDFLIPRLPRFMTPRFIEFVSDVPRTPTGKIQKKLLRNDPLHAGVWDRVAQGVEIPR